MLTRLNHIHDHSLRGSGRCFDEIATTGSEEIEAISSDLKTTSESSGRYIGELGYRFSLLLTYFPDKSLHQLAAPSDRGQAARHRKRGLGRRRVDFNFVNLGSMVRM